MNGLRRISQHLVKAVAAGGLLLAAALPFALATTAGATFAPSTPPATPTGLTASSGLDTSGVADGTIVLSWNASVSGTNNASPASGYNVYEGTTKGGESTTPVNGAIPLTGTSLTVPGLTDGTAYYFTVTAENSYGTSPASTEASDTPAGITSAPTVTIAGGNSESTLSWTAPASINGSAVVGYNVYVTTVAPSGGTDAFVTALNASTGGSWLNANGGVNGSNAPACASSGTYVPFNGPDCTSLGAYSAANLITGTSETVTGLNNGAAYYFVVTAVNGVGESQGVLASNLATTPGTVPVALTGVAVSVTGTTASLTWGTNAGETYNVFEGTTAGGESATPVNAAPLADNGAGNTYLVTGLLPNTTYYFEVTALNAVGSSPASNEVLAVTGAGAAAAPTGLTVVPSNTAVTLSWTAPTNTGGSSISGYEYEYSTNAGLSYTGGPTATGSTATTFTVTGLSNTTNYLFKVAAVTGAGIGTYSAASAAVTPAPTVPAAISNLAVWIGSGTATLSWSVPNAEGGTISGFNVYEGTASGAETLVESVPNGAATGTTVTVASSGTYYFTVAAVSNLGTGAMSNEASATSGATFAAAPTALTNSIVASSTTTGGGDSQVLISFTPPANDGGGTVTSYDVFNVSSVSVATAEATPGTYLLLAAASCTPGTPCVNTTNSDATDYAIGGLTGGLSYSFVLVPVNHFGASDGQAGRTQAASSPISFTAPNLSNAPTGISASQSGSNAVVSWNAPLNADGTTAVAYEVSYSATNSFSGATLLAACSGGSSPCLTSAISGASATIANLTPGTLYYFWVTASNDGASFSAASADASTTLVSPPVFSSVAGTASAAPGTMTVSHGALVSGTITHWSATAAPGGLSCTGTSDASCTIVGLTNGVTYTITVSVTTATGTVSGSFTPSAQPLGSPVAPGAVTVSAQGTGAQTDSVTFNWTQPANGGSAITSYHVTSTNPSTLATSSYLVASAGYAYYVSNSNTSPSSEAVALAYLETHATLYCIVPSGYDAGGADNYASALNQAVPASTTCTIYDISSAGSPTFVYNVSATNTNGTATSAASAATTLSANGTVPGAPTDFVAVPGATTSTVDLSWAAPSSLGGATFLGYNIYEGTTSGAESATPVNGVTPISGLSAAVPGLTLGVTYYFTVKAVNTNGQSAPGYNATFTAAEISYTALGSPGVVTGLSAVAGAGNSVTVTWSAPASDGGVPILGYLIYAGPNSTGLSNTPVNVSLVSGLTYTVTGLSPGTTYDFVVVADNGAGFSDASAVVSATTSGTVGVPILPTVTGSYFVPTFSTNAAVVVNGTGFTPGMTVTSSNPAYTVTLAGIGGTINALGSGTTATLSVTTTSAATSGTSTAIVFTNPDGGAVSFALNGGPAVKPPVATKPFASGTTGRAIPGRIVKVFVHGVHFYAAPKVTSSSPGTTVRVAADNGKVLVLLVKTPFGTRRGVKVFTIRFLHGQVSRARYIVS
ncbi:MAG TPA: fibronectin type III domain-containing protein [Acidimicrobiales bacterium]|nr:fibronectin type III domain-containing protein [Acidimicrobiales bacterium]